MSEIKIDNSIKNAITKGKWKDPGAKLYDDILLNSNWKDLLKEAYLVAPVNDITNELRVRTRLNSSGCKYPHHLIKDGKLVVSISGLRSAYICARNQGCFNTDSNNRPEYSRSLVTHLNKHFKELGIKPIWHHGELYFQDIKTKKFVESNDIIESNFNSMYSYIMERSGINLFDTYLEHEPGLTGPNDSELSSEIHNIVGRTPESIYEWMHNNISYDKTISGWKLKTPAETFKLRKGNCHDQSLFTSFLFHSLGIINGQLFFVEFKKNSPIGGNTHTLTWYRVDTPNEDFKYSYYWFENAWEDQAGIHGPYNDIKGLKHAILEIYKKDNDINSHKYDGIVFSSLSNYRCGMNLGKYVASWRLEDDYLINDDPDEKFYRVTHNGIGIYEAIRKHCSAGKWKELLSSKIFTWLPKPKEYPQNGISYFTKEGIDMFNELVLPEAEGILGDNIKVDTFTSSEIGNIVYRDKYQVIANDNRIKEINECIEWIEKFVNDESFQESVMIEETIKDFNRPRISPRLYIENTYDLIKKSEDIMDQTANINSEGENNKDPFVPIFGIVKSYSHSKLRNDGSAKNDSELNSVKFDKIIHALTRGDNYSHALVSFDLSLTEMYSYEDEGFCIDNIMEKDSWMGTKSIYICVMFVKKEDRDRMKKFVEELKEHPEQTKYAMGNLIKAYIATPTKIDKRFVCSSFTGYIMACSNPKNLHRDYSRLRPDDITILPRAFYVTNCIDREDFKNRKSEIVDIVKNIFNEYKEDIEDYNNHLPRIMLEDRVDKLKTIDRIFDWIVNKLA